jgi:hypothetical protein
VARPGRLDPARAPPPRGGGGSPPPPPDATGSSGGRPDPGGVHARYRHRRAATVAANGWAWRACGWAWRAYPRVFHFFLYFLFDLWRRAKQPPPLIRH